MKTSTLHTVALALTLGFATAASAGDFDFGHPDQDVLQTAAPAATSPTPERAAAKRVAVAAAMLKRDARGRVSTEETRAMVGEDSGSFWLSQHLAHPAQLRTAPALARLEAGPR